jgi:hypothetical protein
VVLDPRQLSDKVNSSPPLQVRCRGIAPFRGTPERCLPQIWPWIGVGNLIDKEDVAVPASNTQISRGDMGRVVGK